MTANFLFRNLGGFRFEEVGARRGRCRQRRAGASRRAWASPAATSTATAGPTWPSPTSTANRPRSSATSAPASSPTHTAAGLAVPSRYLLGFGIAFLDADNDGRLDLLTANGHVNDDRPSFPWKMPVQLLSRDRSGRLVDVSEQAGAPFRPLHLGRGLAVGDLDNDGQVDAIAACQNEPLVYLSNRTAQGGHWLTVQLEGTTSNRDAIGARVAVEAGGDRQVAHRFGGGSYQSAGDPRLHFGIGAEPKVDRVEVRWPSGRVDRHEAIDADRAILVREADPAVRPLRGWSKRQ